VKLHALIIPLFLFAACHKAPEPKPVSLSGGIANTFLRTYRIELRSDTLLYYDGPWGEQNVQPVAIHPTKQQWADFRKALDQSNAWQWQKEYNAAMMDGTAWELKIQYPDHAVDSGGFNGYPPSFASVAAAVEKLLGGKPFRIDQP
jgi:hypothetical protein